MYGVNGTELNCGAVRKVPLPIGGLSCASPSANGWSKLSESLCQWVV